VSVLLLGSVFPRRL